MRKTQSFDITILPASSAGRRNYDIKNIFLSFYLSIVLSFYLLILLAKPSFAVFDPSPTWVNEPSYVPNQAIVRYKQGQSPQDVQNQVASRESRTQSFFGQIQNTWENFALRMQNQETPEDKLNRLVSVNSQAGVVSSQALFESKVLGAGTPPELQGFILYQTNGAQSVGEMVQSYSQLPEVEFAEPNYIYTIQAVPNDTYYPQMWNLEKMQMEQAWEQTKGSNQVTVAVIDTGADYNHEDLKDHLVPGYNFVSGSNNAQDDNGHGTHVSGTIGALTNNAKGVSGINWEVKIMPLKALNARGSGGATVYQAVYYAADNGARVINMSLGGSGNCSQAQTYQAAIDYARGKGVVVIVAAGNSNTDAGNFTPASCSGVITVAATGSDDERAHYSNYGTVVDLSAPGGNPPGGSSTCSNPTCILSTFPNNTYRALAGTSMASPHVAGAAALLLAKNSNLTPDQVETYLKNNTDQATSSVPIGSGRLNVNKALAAVSGGTQPTATPTVTPTGSTVTPSPTITPPAGEPTATPTPPTSSPSPSPTPLTSPTLTPGAHPCPEKALIGDYNCDGAVNEKDFSNPTPGNGEKKGWLEDYKEGKATLSFFEYWRRAFFTP